MQNNVHKHTSTCYKYSKTDKKKVCRMRMPRKIQESSTIDPESGLIMMSKPLLLMIIERKETNNCSERHHSTINNYNEYIMAACRCNMDIKFIWTGSDTKALIYYVSESNA